MRGSTRTKRGTSTSRSTSTSTSRTQVTSFSCHIKLWSTSRRRRDRLTRWRIRAEPRPISKKRPRSVHRSYSYDSSSYSHSPSRSSRGSIYRSYSYSCSYSYSSSSLYSFSPSAHPFSWFSLVAAIGAGYDRRRDQKPPIDPRFGHLMPTLEIGSFRSRTCQGVTRRAFLSAGVAAPFALASSAHARSSPVAEPGKAKSVLLVWLGGGPSHLDLFDPKPKAPVEFRGPFATIATQTPGVRFTELLPKLAARSHKFSLIRSNVNFHDGHREAGSIALTAHRPPPRSTRRISARSSPDSAAMTHSRVSSLSPAARSAMASAPFRATAEEPGARRTTLSWSVAPRKDRLKSRA